MSHGRREEEHWQDDVARRQRNIVFPDTVENEGRFWRGILRGERQLTTTQKIGAAIVLLALVGTWAGIMLMVVANGEGALWARVLNVGVPLAGAVVLLLVFMAVIGWQTRRERRRRSIQ